LDHVIADPPLENADQQTMLVFRSPDDGRMAIPLSRVARLEEFPRPMVERVGHELLAQYRGEIMPVLELSNLVPERRLSPRGAPGPPHAPRPPRAPRPPHAPPPATRLPMAHDGQFCTFLVRGMLFGLEVTRIQEVIRYQPLTAVPLTSPVIAGLINLRGQIVTAIDLRIRLGLPPREPDERPLNVVVRTADGPVSLLVDDIGDVIQ